jgi:hypothetical protein
MTYLEKIATDFGVTDLEKSRSILGSVVISWGQAETVDFPRPNCCNKGLKPLAAQRFVHGGIRVSGETTTGPKPLAAQRFVHGGIGVSGGTTTGPKHCEFLR